MMIAALLLLGAAGTPPVHATPATHAVVDFRAVASEPSGITPSRVHPAPRTFPVVHPAVPNDRLGPGSAAPAGGTILPLSSKITPRPVANFASLPDDGYTDPPDTNGVAGPDHLVTALNTGIKIQDKLGTSQLETTIESFVSPVVSNVFVSDPHIAYDPIGQRYLFTVLYLNPPDGSTGGLVFAASQTSDPTGSWNMYAFPNQDPGFAFVDYPALGFDKDWVVVTTNNFSDTSVRANVWIVPKADLYSGQPAPTATVFFEDNGYTLVPAWTYDATLPYVYLVEDWNGSVSELRLAAVGDSAGTPTYTLGGIVKGSVRWSDGTDSGSFCPQKGTSARLDGSDGRLMNAVYHDGSLWTSHGVYLSGGPLGSHIAAQWWQIQPAADVTQDVNAVQQGRLEDPSGAVQYTYDSIGVDDAGDVLIGGTRFSSNGYPSAFIAFHGATDAPDTTRAAYVYKQGLDYVSKGGGDTRWGDYSMTARDPDGKTFWTIQEYGESGGHRWGTWWAHVDPSQNATASSHGKGCGCDLAGGTAGEVPGVAVIALCALGALIADRRRRAGTATRSA